MEATIGYPILTVQERRLPTSRTIIRMPRLRSEAPEFITKIDGNYDVWSSPEIDLSKILDAPANDSMSSETSTSSSEDGECHSCPTMEAIEAHRRLQLPASPFPHGCVCGHLFDHRAVIYENRKRKNLRCPGITIRPKIVPVDLKFTRIL